MDIICFANDWDWDPLSKKHIMRGLAGRGARVLWVNSLGNRSPRLGDAKDWRRAAGKLRRFALAEMRGPRLVQRGIWVLDPIAVPAYGSGWAAYANRVIIGSQVRAAARSLGFSQPVHYSFVPASAWVAGRLGERLLVYHAVDEHGAFEGANADAIAKLEANLLEHADLYIACSEPLMSAHAPQARRALLVRHGVDYAHFATTLQSSLPIASELANVSRPILGFVGLIAEWIDSDVLWRLGDALEAQGHGTVVLVGEAHGIDPRDLKRLSEHPRVLLLGRKPYERLPSYLRGFDVALLPFVINSLTIHSNPLKLREYVAAGLPVIASDLAEVRALAETIGKSASDAITIADDPSDFIIKAMSVAKSNERGPREARSLAVKSEAWEMKVVEIENALANAMQA